MITILLPALVTPAPDGFLELSDSSGSLPDANTDSSSPVYEFFKKKPIAFCQGFANPIDPVSRIKILTFDIESFKREKQNLHKEEGLDYDEKFQKTASKIIKLPTKAGKFCNTSPEVLATLNWYSKTGKDASSSYDFSKEKKMYFRKWWSCFFEKLGEDLPFFELSFPACKENNKRFCIQLPCRYITKEFENLKAKRSMSGDREDDSSDPSGGRFRSSPRKRRPFPQKKKDRCAGIRKDEDGKIQENLKLWIASHEEFDKEFFKNPSKFCSDLRDKLMNLRKNNQRGQYIKLYKPSMESTPSKSPP